MLRPRERNVARLLLLLFFALFLPAEAESAMQLFSGNQCLGNVGSVRQGAHTLVSATEMASLLEFPAVAKDDTLVVTAGRNKIQLVSGASAAWLDVELVPLAASCVQRDGHWFLESGSALKLFNSLLARSGKNVVLRWGAETNGGTPAPAVTPPAPPKTPPSPVPEAPSASAPSSVRPILKGVRWGIDDEKIRAVLDFEGNGEPEVQRSAGGVKIFFSSGPWPVPGIPSPYREVNAGAMNFGDRLLIDLGSSLSVHEIISLDAPKRLVVDFRRGGAAGTPVSPPVVVDAPRPAPAPTPSLLPSQSVVTPRPSVRTGKRIVVIDAGHGGKDPGAVANKIREKDLNLTVSRLLVARLKEFGIDARLTRDSDVYLTLRRRTEIANAMNADLFVSIHGNALPPGRSATGMEIYLMALPTDKDAMELARFENRELAEDNGDSTKAADKRTQTLLAILGNMQQNAKISESTGFAEYLFNAGKSGGLKMRRVAQAPFYVLRGAAMPAVLVELGFLTDKQEAKLLADKTYQQKMADALARGIRDYLKNN